ncbi:DUF551 domain-containing protein [Enterobacter hormaechei]|uniref:DUF551 domain-containing protein n=1 Tax=Enterobacter hormaechei TaxID=158836 RepID=UPI003076404A
MTFTKERIANLLEFNSEGSDCQANAEQWEVHELARIALASLEADPIGFAFADDVDLMRKKIKVGRMLTVRHQGEVALYTAQPAPVSDSLLSELLGIAKRAAYEADECAHAEFSDNSMEHSAAIADLERRAAMLQSFGNSEQLNSPGVPDTWVVCSERMPQESGRYWCYVEEQNDLGKSHYQWNCSWNGDRWWVESENGGRVTHWMPLPAAPQQEESK